MKNVAVVLAGGVGRRIGAEMPKQFLKIAGRSVVEYAIEAFCKHVDIDEVAVVVHPEWREEMERIVAHNGWEKLKRVIDGGRERYQSAWAAIEAYGEEENLNLWIHDAARPAVSARIIGDVSRALASQRAVVVAMPSTDTVYRVEDGEVTDLPDRQCLYLAQTPQAFRLDILKRAYTKAIEGGNVRATDDCGIVRKYCPEVRVHVVEGERRNMKLTYKEDIDIISRLLKNGKE